MTTHDAVPERSGELMFADTGLETDLIFNENVELPLFAAFVLTDRPGGRDLLERWHRDHAAIAIEHGFGVSLDGGTWRASSDWGDQLGYGAVALDRVNRELTALMHEIRDDIDAHDQPVRVGGTLGPRGDGYQPAFVMTPIEAAGYHTPQLRSFVEAGVDRVCAMTLGYVGEAVGIVAAATTLGVPVIVGFTLETDGRLPDGTTLQSAIEHVDAATDAAAAGFMVNCAHPDHIAGALTPGVWTQRLMGLRPNASRRSHTELDDAPDLDAGNPDELGSQVAALRATVPSITLIGGCCGTDLRHARAIAAAL